MFFNVREQSLRFFGLFGCKQTERSAQRVQDVYVQMQFVVVSPEELRDAQAHPEKYENLQIRVCGWNVRWNDMPKSEQDEYILRAERIMR